MSHGSEVAADACGTPTARARTVTSADSAARVAFLSRRGRMRRGLKNTVHLFCRW
jgi:hypothetical protein